MGGGQVETSQSEMGVTAKGGIYTLTNRLPGPNQSTGFQDPFAPTETDQPQHNWLGGGRFIYLRLVHRSWESGRHDVFTLHIMA